MTLLRHKKNNTPFGTGDLSGITEVFFDWMTKLNSRKQGTIMKSLFLSQITITKEQVQNKILQSGSCMSNKDWAVVAIELDLYDIPHSWFIIREAYLR